MVCAGGRVAIRHRSRKTGVIVDRELRNRDGARCDSIVDSKKNCAAVYMGILTDFVVFQI
jgi:hypothetical protein